MHPDLPRVTVAYNAYQFALCLAELDFETNKAKIQELVTSAIRALTRTIDVSSETDVKCADDFDELNAFCPMFFSERVSAYEVLFDVLLMQSRLYGLDTPDKAELCLNVIIKRSSKIGDIAA